MPIGAAGEKILKFCLNFTIFKPNFHVSGQNFCVFLRACSAYCGFPTPIGGGGCPGVIYIRLITHHYMIMFTNLDFFWRSSQVERCKAKNYLKLPIFGTTCAITCTVVKYFSISLLLNFWRYKFINWYCITINDHWFNDK